MRGCGLGACSPGAHAQLSPGQSSCAAHDCAAGASAAPDRSICSHAPRFAAPRDALQAERRRSAEVQGALVSLKAQYEGMKQALAAQQAGGSGTAPPAVASGGGSGHYDLTSLMARLSQPGVQETITLLVDALDRLQPRSGVTPRPRLASGRASPPAPTVAAAAAGAGSAGVTPRSGRGLTSPHGSSPVPRPLRA